MAWNDLTDEAERMNALLEQLRAPLKVHAGKRALQWFKFYQGLSPRESAYSISRGEARKILAAFGYQLD